VPRSATILLVSLCLVAAALLGRATSSADRSPSPQAAAISTSTTEPPRPEPSNPVLDLDFPDPHISTLDDGTHLAVATNSGELALQMSSSEDLLSWSAPIDALGRLPTWARTTQPDLWAPTYIETDAGHAVLFAVRGARTGRHCIGAATAQQATGPYEPIDEPIVCMAAEGGSIDPSIFEDETGGRHLLWKTDGNCCGLPTVLWSQPFDTSTLSVVGTPSQLLTDGAAWEQGVIEAPEMFVHDGRHFLTYSGGRYADGSYGVGAAVCDGPSGPCQRTRAAPILASTPTVTGPGGQTVIATRDGLWIAYHGWDPAAVGYVNGGKRSLRIDELRTVGDQLVVLGPTAASGG
jgi:beta-xylosidase